jgi:hypothetical protein
VQNSTLFDKLLKEFYVPGKLESMYFKFFPFMERLAKKKGSGKYVVQPVINGANVRVSPDYSVAWTSLTEVAPAVAFQVPYTDLYGIAAIDGKLWLQSEDNVGAFVSAFKQTNDGLMASMRKATALMLPRSGSGSVAQLGGSSTAATIQALAKREMAYCFEIGDIVAASSADGGALRNPASGKIGAKVVNITSDGTTAYLHFDTVLNTSITDVGASDYLYVNKGYAQNNSATFKCLTGLLGYSPATTASLTVSFHGVTRSEDERRLRGLYVDNPTSAPIHEQIQTAISQLIANGAQGAKLEVYCNPTDGLKLSKVAGTQVQRSQGGTATFGFRTHAFQTRNGADVTVFEDPSFPAGLAFVVDMDALALYHLGASAIRIRQAGDATKIKQIQGTTAWGIELEAFLAFVAERPGQCIATVNVA